MLDSQAKNLRRTLRSRFKIKTLRPNQEDVIANVMAGKNTLTIMPTGGGKSLCYQLPALHLPGTTIVISPLISLMKDQREKLVGMKLEAIAFNSTLSAAELAQNLRTMATGRAEFIYVTPERLADPDFLKLLKKVKIDFVVIDEAHCISQWGHDFRPAFLSISAALRALKHPPVLALTATATPEVIEDIRVQLKLDDLEIFRSPLVRDNLTLSTRIVDSDREKRDVLFELLRARADQNGLVYASTVKAVDDLHERLRAANIPALKYHGRLRPKEREAAQDEFMTQSPRLMIATNAFGMGIDKPDIRFVIHFNFPGSPEAYYQEAGRVGRDGGPAECILLYLKKDKSTQALFLARKYPNPDELTLFYAALDPEMAKEELEQKLDGRLPARKIAQLLSFMRQLDVIRPAGRGRWKLIAKKLTPADLTALADRYREREEKDRDKLKRVIMYAQTALCRWHALADYFDDDEGGPSCGHCDNCLRVPVSFLKCAAANADDL